MIGPYMEQHEREMFDKFVEHDDTISCWIATRINGASASLACDGNVSVPLLNKLDEKILPLIKGDG